MTQKRRDFTSLNDSSIRSRLATTRPDQRKDIGRVWMEQKRLSEERWKLAPEDKPIFKGVKESFQKYIQSLRTKFSSLRIPGSIPFKWSELKNQVKKKPKIFISGALAVLIFFPLVLAMTQKKGNSKDVPKSLGVTSVQSTGSDDGKTEEKPNFSILHPTGKGELLEVTRKTPTGVLLHTYRDTVEGAEVEVTQQELPESFKSSPTAELEKMAKNFQATDIIQIDEAFVYHGLDEKTRVQSLFTIKNNVLISIRSNIKLSDDTWAGYIISLQ